MRLDSLRGDQENTAEQVVTVKYCRTRRFTLFRSSSFSSSSLIHPQVEIAFTEGTSKAKVRREFFFRCCCGVVVTGNWEELFDSGQLDHQLQPLKPFHSSSSNSISTPTIITLQGDDSSKSIFIGPPATTMTTTEPKLKILKRPSSSPNFQKLQAPSQQPTQLLPLQQKKHHHHHHNSSCNNKINSNLHQIQTTLLIVVGIKSL
ncbi:unnamed protein product [Lepeophtheirus salmonis]|uniref:(salmon louse) hypothetical protein n=1 Tax=Lepeophtheirus salmonis TaxID=72036 RepID=A0A7R8CJ22_LEPSM|nr:unnamed protein product [Lepeophtheirus salmonis]CAF2837795.1 unnamed protein product [Lepeophtheirus salmonis]